MFDDCARSHWPGRRREQHHLADAAEELIELERTVVDRRGQPKAVVDERRLAREVALVHAPDLRDRLVGLVDERDEVVGEVVDQRVRRAARRAPVEDSGVVLDPRAEADLAQHLDVVLGPLREPVGLELLALGLEGCDAVAKLALDLLDGALERLLLGHVMAGGPDRDVVERVEDLAGERVEVLDRLDLVAEQLDPIGGLGVRGHDLEHLTPGAERATAEVGVVAAVLHCDELAEDLLAVDPVADLEQLHLVAVELRGADPVDARDRGDDDHVLAGEQRRGRRVAQPVDLVVDR